MDLASYLLKPVQRMGKYALLLQQLMKSVTSIQGPSLQEISEDIEELQKAEEMVRFQLRHGNDLLAMDSLRDCDVSSVSVFWSKIHSFNSTIPPTSRPNRWMWKSKVVCCAKTSSLSGRDAVAKNHCVRYSSLRIWSCSAKPAGSPTARIWTCFCTKIASKHRTSVWRHSWAIQRPNSKFGSANANRRTLGHCKALTKTSKMLGPKRYRSCCGSKRNGIVTFEWPRCHRWESEISLVWTFVPAKIKSTIVQSAFRNLKKVCHSFHSHNYLN